MSTPVLNTPPRMTPTPRAGALREQLGSAAIQQRVAAGEQDAVEVDARDEPFEHRGLVHPAPDRGHHAFVAQAQQGRERVAEGVVLVVVGVVHENHVDAIRAESLQARLRTIA